MAEQDFNADSLLAWQLKATDVTWARLQACGMSEGSELQLDFVCEAPTIARATELMRLRERETDYEMRVTADEDQWTLRGRTQPAALSLAPVKQWVDWMITAGLSFECLFDGWGTDAP